MAGTSWLGICPASGSSQGSVSVTQDPGSTATSRRAPAPRPRNGSPLDRCRHGRERAGGAARRLLFRTGRRAVSGPLQMGGGHLADVTAELALGVLTGRERAQATKHLEECDACRTQVQDTSVTAEQLLQLLPRRQPPAGFAARVISGLSSTGRQRTRRMLSIAAGTIIAMAAGLAGWVLRTASAPSTPPGGPSPAALTSAMLITTGHRAIGTVFLHGGRQRFAYMTVDTGAGNGHVICQFQGRDGRLITIGSFRLTAGYGWWGSPEPDQPAAVTGARLITTGGMILATATFPTTR
jgi:hypothetical protein